MFPYGTKPENFKDLKSSIEYVTKYYGFYRKKHSLHSKMIPLIKQHCGNFRRIHFHLL